MNKGTLREDRQPGMLNRQRRPDGMMGGNKIDIGVYAEVKIAMPQIEGAYGTIQL